MTAATRTSVVISAALAIDGSTGCQPYPGCVVVGPVPVPGCVFAPCGRNVWHARRAFFTRGDFGVSPRGSISTTLPSTTFGSRSDGMPCRRTHAANLRSGRRTNETGLAQKVSHAPLGTEDEPVVVIAVVAEVMVDPWGCAPAGWDAASAAAANRPAPRSAASIVARTPIRASRVRREPVADLCIGCLDPISVPRFELAEMWSLHTVRARRLRRGYRCGDPHLADPTQPQSTRPAVV